MGSNEELVGEALKPVHHKVVIVTKIMYEKSDEVSSNE